MVFYIFYFFRKFELQSTPFSVEIPFYSFSMSTELRAVIQTVNTVLFFTYIHEF